jgi:hypothetical protein
MFPFKEKKEILECYDNFPPEQDKEKRIEFLKNYLKKYFNSIEAHRAYQAFMMRLGESDSVYKEYRSYLEKNPDDPNFNYLFSRLLSDKEAEFYLNKSLEKNDNFYWGHLGLAYYYFHNCNPPKTEAAKEHLLKAIKIDKTKPNAYFSFLTIYRNENNKKNMLEMLEILVKFFPERDYLFLDYADLKFKNKKEFKKALEKKLKTILESALLKKAFADLNLSEGNFDEAIRYLEEALKDEKYDKNLIQTLNFQLAELHGMKKDEKKTLYYLNEAKKQGFKGYELIRDNKNFEFLKENKEFINLIKEFEAKKPATVEKNVRSEEQK